MKLPLKQYWRLLVRYLQPIQLKVILLGGLIFGGIGLQLFSPQLIKRFIDTALAGGELSVLLWTALAFLGASLLRQGVDLAAAYTGEDVGWRATNALRADLAGHCLRLDMAFHTDHTPGEMTECIDGDVTEIATFFARFVLQILGNVILIGGILLVLLGEDWRLSAALAVYAVIALLGFIRVRDIAVPYWDAARQADADLFGFLEEHLAGLEDLKANGATGYVLHRLLGYDQRRFERTLRGDSMSTYVLAVWFGVHTLGYTVAFVSSYTLFQQGLLTVGSVFLVLYYTQLTFGPLRAISNEIQQVQRAVASAERVESLSRQESALKSGGEVLPADEPLGVIFKRVTFRYHDRAPVLRDLSFELEPGRVLGLLGRTGSGKTTITRLLLRLYDPQSGVIYLSDKTHRALPSLAFDQLRSRVALVTQDVQLFRASIRDNLTFFDRRLTDARLYDAIEALGLSDWLAGLPDRLDTLLTAGGRNLSAGEAQLLAFTRVFLKEPGLIILDEASSRLDPVTERLIEGAIDRLLQDRTGIIIAHRLNTVHRADRIMILDGGQIQEFGNYDQLVADPSSRFAQLLQTGLEPFLI